MWPFRKKVDLSGQGFGTDTTGNPVFDFTADELRAINNYLKMLEGKAILKGWEDRVKNLTIARALSEYAQEQAFDAEQESDSRKKQGFVNNALSSAFKACNVYPHPILDYELACFSLMAGKKDVAIPLFRKFLSEHKPSQPNTLDSMLLQGRDIEKALQHAKGLIGGL